LGFFDWGFARGGRLHEERTRHCSRRKPLQFSESLEHTGVTQLPFTLLSVGALLGLICFLFLRPRYQLFLGLVVSTSFFDILPRQALGVDAWDVGVCLIFLAALRTMGQTPQVHNDHTGIDTVVGTLVVWFLLCLAWSIFIYQYPLLDSIKSARQLTLGYLTFFAFRRIFRCHPEERAPLWRYLYLATCLLLPVCVLQAMLRRPLLYSLSSEYEGAFRAIPSFLPFILIFLWRAVVKALAGDRISILDLIFGFAAVLTIGLTYTRSVYISCALGLIAVCFLLLRRGRLSMGASLVYSAIVLIGMVIAANFDITQRIASRVLSGLTVLAVSSPSVDKTDTFTGRLALARERFSLVTDENPVVGYGFIQERNVPSDLRAKLRFGSVVDTPDYQARYAVGLPYVLALLSVDIGWADVIVKTGLVGLGLFAMLIYVNLRRAPEQRQHPEFLFDVALYVQFFVSSLLMFASDSLLWGSPIISLIMVSRIAMLARAPQSPADGERFPNLL